MPSPAAILNILITANNQQAMATIAKTDAAVKASAATAESAGARTAASYARTGKTLQTVGNAMTKYVTLPAAAVGVASVKMAKDFNDAMMQIHSSAGASMEEVNRMHDAILALARSGEVEQGPKQLAEGLFHIESQGFRSAKALRILKAAAQGADIGNANLEDTTRALGGVMKSLHAPSSKATAIMSQLIKIVGQGDLRMEDLVSALSTGVVPAARTFGLTLRDVGAALDVMTQRGMGATQSATRLRMTFSMLAAPTDAAKEALASIGLSADELANTMRTKNLPAAIALLQQHLEGVSKTRAGQILSQAFGGGRTSAAIMLLTQNVGDFRKAYAGAGEDVTGFNAKLRADAETTQSKLNVAWSQIQASLISVGESLGPVVAKMAQMLAVIAKLAAKIPGFAELLVAAFVAGPIIKFIGWIYRLRAAYLALAAAQATAAATGAGAGAGGAAGVFGRLGAAARVAAGGIGALTAAYVAYKGVSESIKTRHEDIVGPGGDLAKAQLNEQAFEKIIAQYKASEQGLTTSRAHQVAVRIMQMAKEGKVSAQWAADHIKAMRNAEAATHPFQNAMSTMGMIVRKNFAGLGKTAQFEMRKVMDAILHGRDPVQALGASFGNLENKISKAMQQGKISVEKGTKMINSLIAQERAMLGLPPIAGGAFTLPSQQHGPKTKKGAGPHMGGLGYASGGHIRGPMAGDKIPLLAEGGEFMVNAKATKRFLPLLQRINDAVPRFAKGGQLAGLKFAGTGPGNIDDMAAAALNMEADWARNYIAKLKPTVGVGKPGNWGPVDALAAAWHLARGTLTGRLGQPGSWHGVAGPGGRARATDYSGGAHDMLVFARKMARRYGSNLLELIHTPLGFGIKNGQRVPPYAAADHYDHVHVAMQRGGQIFGSGNLSKDQLTTLAAYVGMSNPARMAAIALAESGGNPRAMGGAGDKGLWQIIPSTAAAFGINYGKLFDPIKNARGAGKILKGQGLGAWTTYRSGAYRRFLGGQVKPGLMAILKGNATGGTAPGLGGSLKNAKPKATQPGLLGGLKGTIDRDALLEAMKAQVEIENTRRGNINELRAAQNLLALQRYQTGAAQNPLLGIPSPAMPVLAEMLGMQPEAFLYAQRTAPVRSGKAKKGYGFGAGIVGQAQPPPVHVHVHARKGAPDFTSWLDVQIEKKQKKAARLGRRRLPSAGAR